MAAVIRKIPPPAAVKRARSARGSAQKESARKSQESQARAPLAPPARGGEYDPHRLPRLFASPRDSD
jgi:hypothetical protein